MTTTLEELWRQVEAITPPEPIFASTGPESLMLPVPLPVDMQPRKVPVRAWAAVGAVALLSLLVPTLLWLPIVAAVPLGIWTLATGSTRRVETRRRETALAEAGREHAALIQTVDAVGPAGFASIRRDLETTRHQHDVEVPAAEGRALAAFERTAAQQQLRTYLARCSIDRATIPGLGPSRRATLRASGVTTAAQVDGALIDTLPGFGPVLAGALVDWRNACTAAFRFDPADPAMVQNREEVLRPFRQRRAELTSLMAKGLGDLRLISRPPSKEVAQLGQRLAVTSQRLAQAQLDVAAIR